MCWQFKECNASVSYTHLDVYKRQKYACVYLVYYESFEYPKEGIAREQQLKGWRREKKNMLIADFNPTWENLNTEIF